MQLHASSLQARSTRGRTSCVASPKLGALVGQHALRSSFTGVSTNLVVDRQRPAYVGAATSRSRGTVRVQARYGSAASRGTPEIVDRVMAAAPYILPFLNSFVYARFLYTMQPLFRSFMRPILPAISAYSSVPFASFIAFFGLYLGVVNNTKLTRFVRFNAMQAILLDICLVLPRLIESVVSPPTSGWGVQIYANMQSSIWVLVAVSVVYGIFNAFMGTYGRIPFIGEAADQQIR